MLFAVRTLLQALWQQPDRDGAITFWLAPSRRSIHVPLRKLLTMTAADEKELAEIAGSQHVYFGLGLRQEGLKENQQGGKKHVIAMPGFCIDIDFYDPIAHVATNLPRDLDEAEVLFGDYPDPSAIVHTGNGCHAYWFFVEPVELKTNADRVWMQRGYKKFQAPMIKKAKELGWHVDSTATIQRVWRVPGFNNPKTNKPVELAYCGD